MLSDSKTNSVHPAWFQSCSDLLCVGVVLGASILSQASNQHPALSHRGTNTNPAGDSQPHSTAAPNTTKQIIFNPQTFHWLVATDFCTERSLILVHVAFEMLESQSGLLIGSHRVSCLVDSLCGVRQHYSNLSRMDNGILDYSWKGHLNCG